MWQKPVPPSQAALPRPGEKHSTALPLPNRQPRSRASLVQRFPGRILKIFVHQNSCRAGGRLLTETLLKDFKTLHWSAVNLVEGIDCAQERGWIEPTLYGYRLTDRGFSAAKNSALTPEFFQPIDAGDDRRKNRAKLSFGRLTRNHHWNIQKGYILYPYGTEGASHA
jgi:hypothetical protein